ncbi:MAG: RNA polymerase subunit sigma [Planctomycetaceae bacterium]|nr:RNA polymerase subunit sigma [Planctomycetaceae bacterium]
MTDVTQLLNQIESGKADAADLLPHVYEELRRLAATKMAQERPDHTLQPTALVHEAYVRLVGPQETQWNSRGHFFAAAAEAMRRILVETAGQKQSQKRGGDQKRIASMNLEMIEDSRTDEVLEVHEALEWLAAESEQAAQLVKLRYFGGLSLGDAANCLGVSRRTADRLWAYAKAWLFRELRR